MASRGRSAPRAGDKPDMRKVPDFTEQDIKELKEAFDVFDKKGNGIIDVNDLLDFMESLRINTKFPTTFTLVDRLNEI